MADILQFPFIQRALIAGILLAALLAFLGVFVILRRMAFFGDGIAHASLAGIAIAILAGTNPLVIAILFSVALAIAIYFLEKKTNLSSDTIIGIIFTASMSLGVLLISFKSGYQPELISFLFGNILAIQTTELILMAVLAAGLITWLSVNFKKIALSTIDRESAFLSGINVNLLDMALYIAMAVAVVLGVKILGIVLVSALLIIPPSIAKISAASLRGLVVVSIIMAEITVIVGIFLSYRLDWPTGATIVLTGTAIFCIALLMDKLIKPGHSA
ncbi:MAG: metal ABC transporter permease [Patescibacteria group bacterium]